jgi:hypothetical protein
MSIRLYFTVAALLIALSAAWGKRQSLQAFLAPPSPPAKAIQFDNGTVRDMGDASDAASAVAARPQFAPGAMRKCFKGQQVTYTNVTCPTGFKEAPVAGPPVSVVPGLAAGKPASPADLAAAGGKGRSSLHDALDLSKDDQLRQRLMERAIDGHK